MSEKKYDVYVGNDKVGEVWGESPIDIEAKYAAQGWNRERKAREERDPAYKRENDRLRGKISFYNVISKIFGLAFWGVISHSCTASDVTSLSRGTYWWLLGGCVAGWLIFKFFRSMVEDDYYRR